MLVTNSTSDTFLEIMFFQSVATKLISNSCLEQFPVNNILCSKSVLPPPPFAVHFVMYCSGGLRIASNSMLPPLVLPSPPLLAKFRQPQYYNARSLWDNTWKERRVHNRSKLKLKPHHKRTRYYGHWSTHRNTIRDGGGTALYTANTVYAVYIHYLKFRF